MDAVGGTSATDVVVSFTVTIPLRFNPVPGEMEGQPIPTEWVDGVEEELEGRCHIVALDEHYRRLGFRLGGVSVEDLRRRIRQEQIDFTKAERKRLGLD